LATSLFETLAQVTDVRDARGRRHPLGAMLRQAALAVLCGARGPTAIAQWGRAQPAAVVRALGYTRDVSPAPSTFHEVFSTLDIDALERHLGAWAESHLGPQAALAIDGKVLRGTRGTNQRALCLVSIYATDAGLVLAQKGGTDHAAGR
jgi:hypothetical protein